MQVAIDRLGDFDYESRMTAARAIRRSQPGVVIPLLQQAVMAHDVGYVRFRALVLLTGFNDLRGHDTVIAVLDDPNDRLREVAYAYMERHPDRLLIPRLLEALQREQSEFVRPALVRALAAQGADSTVREALMREVDRGEDFFRSTVIEALGDYRTLQAVTTLIRIAGMDGPLQDDAALALGKIGDRRAVKTLASLQRSAPRSRQPVIAAAVCLLGVNCDGNMGYVTDTLRFAAAESGYQPLLRSACTGLAALSISGKPDVLELLFEVGRSAGTAARAPIALAVGTVAIRTPQLVLAVLQRLRDLDGALGLLGEAFDMLKEDFDEEQFYATVRRTYWGAATDSAERRVAEAVIRKLEF